MTILSSAGPFVQSVIRGFDANYPKANANHGEVEVPNIQDEFETSHFPVELRSLVASYSASIEDWTALTGVFQPSLCASDTEQSIEASCRLKLSDLLKAQTKLIQDVISNDAPAEGQMEPLRAREARLESALQSSTRSLSNPFPITAKQALLTYIFNDVYISSPRGREAILSASTELQPILEATQSFAKKTMVKVANFIVAILQDPTFQFIAGLYCAYKIWVVYHVAKAALSVFVTQTLAPTVVNSIINHCPAVVIQAASLAVGTIDWVVNHQWRIFFCKLGVGFLQERLRLNANSLPSRALKVVFDVAMIPTNVAWQLMWLPIGLVLRGTGMVLRGNDQIGTSLKTMSDRVEARRLETGGQKALSLWLEIADQATVERSRLNQQRPIQQAQAAVHATPA